VFPVGTLAGKEFLAGLNNQREQGGICETVRSGLHRWSGAIFRNGVALPRYVIVPIVCRREVFLQKLMGSALSGVYQHERNSIKAIVGNSLHRWLESNFP
jgi:hypothetical protein